MSDLAEWWVNHAHTEADLLVPKAEEYSSYDLEVIGRAMADTIGWEGDRSPATLVEIGISFYLLGKVGRVVGALKDGRLPSLDTWTDASIYAKMVIRAREAGGWPGDTAAV